VAARWRCRDSCWLELELRVAMPGVPSLATRPARDLDWAEEARAMINLNGAGVINLLWMLIGVWMGLLIATALPPKQTEARCRTEVHASS
jgi:hypothetical protein